MKTPLYEVYETSKKGHIVWYVCVMCRRLVTPEHARAKKQCHCQEKIQKTLDTAE